MLKKINIKYEKLFAEKYFVFNHYNKLINNLLLINENIFF